MKGLRPDTFYYVDEKKSGSHPLCDLFFVTKKNELVLIDVYGGKREDEVVEKRKKLDAWIQKNKKLKMKGDSDRDGATLETHGVVLAPFVDGEDMMEGVSDRVAVVRKETARYLLGGLQQVLYWLA